MPRLVKRSGTGGDSEGASGSAVRVSKTGFKQKEERRRSLWFCVVSFRVVLRSNGNGPLCTRVHVAVLLCFALFRSVLLYMVLFRTLFVSFRRLTFSSIKDLPSSFDPNNNELISRRERAHASRTVL